MANLAPYKIKKRGTDFVVVNNANMVKAKFDDRDKAVQYLRALYVNVPGAPKKAADTKWTGKEPKPKDSASLDVAAGEAERAVKKKHKHRPMHPDVHTTYVYGIAAPAAIRPCADCGQGPDAACHTGSDGTTGMSSGGDASGGSGASSSDNADWAAAICTCGRLFATTDGYEAHFVSLHDAEPDPVENAKNDAQILADSAAVVHPGDREKSGLPDGSYPIMNQAQAESAWKLRGRSKNHSEAEVVAHIRSRVKALGLKMPGSDTASANFECCGRKFFTDQAAINHYSKLHFPELFG